MKTVTVSEKIFLSVTAIVFILSAINPHDYLTWFLEVFPGMIGFTLIAYYWKSFRLSRFLLILICIHCLILFVGGHYTYAKVPAGFWVRDAFDLSRNHYDRVGHFFQGFVPAFLAREILLRNKVLKNDGWLKLFVISICLGFSALYELIEFAGAMILKESAESFLGTQGDIWDTQKDMLLALIGAIVALMLAWFHDRSMKKVQ
jgi:putative membrane protein